MSFLVGSQLFPRNNWYMYMFTCEHTQSHNEETKLTLSGLHIVHYIKHTVL